MIIPVRIRKATEGDVATMVEFNAQLAQETEGLSLNRDMTRRGVEDALADPAKGVYWLAEVHGVVVGQLLVTTEWSDWRDGYFWWIQSVFVRKEWRGRGIFQALFDFIHEQAAEHEEVCGVRLYVESANAQAKRVYEHLGMERTHYEVYEMDFRKTPPRGVEDFFETGPASLRG